MRARTTSALGAGAAVFLSLGCNGFSSTAGRHELPASVLAGSTSGNPWGPNGSSGAVGSSPGTGTTPGTTPGTTTPGTGTTPGVTANPNGIAPSRDAVLRPIVDAYVQTGDLPTALNALNAQQATPQELMKMLRAIRPFTAPFVPGPQAFTVTDGSGTQTDMQLVAPPAAEIQKRAANGLCLVVLLHGLNGNAGQIVSLATQLAGTNEVVACGPSVQTLPPGFQPEDGCPANIAAQFPKWWIYEDAHTFALQCVRKACSLYPIDPERVILGGASMGGYGTWNIGLRHADRFAGITPMCGGLTRLGQVGMQDPRSNALLQNGLMFPVWAAHGDQDTVVPIGPDQQAANTLKGMGGDVTFHVLAGYGHNIGSAIATNGQLSAELMNFMQTKRRKSLPLSVNYLSAGTTLDGAHWLRIAQRAGGLNQWQIQGTIDKATNTVAISGNGVTLARVYLDDRILDLTKPVTITVNGAVKSQATATPGFQSILESWRSREDEGLVYPAYVEVDPR
jgi:predicted esterase